jgi:hypothetical protein
VTVNNPPASGNFTAANCVSNGHCYCGSNNNCAFEVIVSARYSPLLSSYWLTSAFNISARAVALINIANGSNGKCVLALGNSSLGPPPVANLANAIAGAGNGPLNLTGCSIGTNSNNAHSITLAGSAHINLIEANGNLGGLCEHGWRL